jgi:hypothetical protein
MKNNESLRDVLRSHSGVAEDSSLFGCYVVSFGKVTNVSKTILLLIQFLLFAIDILI